MLSHVERITIDDWLTKEIKIPGILKNERDTVFDDERLRSAGIRLVYPTANKTLQGVKSGILLELGFDDTAPNRPVTISSWAYDKAVSSGVSMIDNRAVDVPCYAPTHTFVEKCQTISTKYRRLTESNIFPTNFLRHYYDVYCLLALEEVKLFIGQPAYEQYKKRRFRSGDELVIAKNPAFVLKNKIERQEFALQYRKTSALYYQGQPSFEDVLARIHMYIARM